MAISILAEGLASSHAITAVTSLLRTVSVPSTRLRRMIAARVDCSTVSSTPARATTTPRAVRSLCFSPLTTGAMKIARRSGRRPSAAQCRLVSLSSTTTRAGVTSRSDRARRPTTTLTAAVTGTDRRSTRPDRAPTSADTTPTASATTTQVTAPPATTRRTVSAIDKPTSVLPRRRVEISADITTPRPCQAALTTRPRDLPLSPEHATITVSTVRASLSADPATDCTAS